MHFIPKEFPVGCFGMGSILGVIGHSIENDGFPLNKKSISNCIKRSLKTGAIVSVLGPLTIISLDLILDPKSARDNK